MASEFLRRKVAERAAQTGSEVAFDSSKKASRFLQERARTSRGIQPVAAVSLMTSFAAEEKNFVDEWVERRKATELAELNTAQSQPTMAEQMEKARQEANRQRLTEQLAAAGLAVDAGIDRLGEMGSAKAARSMANNQPFAVDDAYKAQVSDVVRQAVTPEQKSTMQRYAEEAELTRAYLDAGTQQERQEIYARLLALQQQKPTHARVMDRVGGAVGGGIVQLEAGVAKALNPTDRGGAADKVLRNVEEANVRGKLGLGKVGGVAYDAAQMLALNAAALAAGGVTGAAAKGVTLGLMGASSGGSSIREAQQAGASDAQAVAAGVANAVAEMAFEYLPLDKLFKLAKGEAKGIVKNNLGTYVAAMAKQAGIEAGTEAATTVAQNVTDLMFYEKELNPDMSLTQWWKNTGSEALYSALLGGIVGGTMGAPAAVAGVRAQQRDAAKVQQNGADAANVQQGDTVPVGGTAGGTGSDGDARKGINENNAVGNAQNGEVEQVTAGAANEAERAANETLAGQSSDSWKARYYVNGDKAYLYSRDMQRGYEIPDKNELDYFVDSNGVSLNSHIVPELDTADYKDFAKAYAAKNLITEFDNNGNAINMRPIKIKEDGKQVIITQKGINDVLKNVRGNRKSASLLDSIFVLDDIIAGAHKSGEKENTKGRVNPYAYYNTRFVDSSGNAYSVTVHIKDTPDIARYHYHNLKTAEIKIEPLDGTSSDNGTIAGADLIARVSANNNIPNSAEYVKAENIGVQGHESAADGQTSTEQENEARKGANQSLSVEQQRAAEVARRLGVGLRWEKVGGFAGQYDEGVISIDPEAGQPLMRLLVHELTHHIENSGYYAALADYVERYISGTMKLDAKAMQRDLAAEYAAGGVELDEDGARRELVAKFCEQKLFTDEAAIERLANTERSLFERIYEWVQDMLVRLRGTAAEAELRRIEKLYIKAAQSTGSEAGSGVRYRIGRTSGNQSFVEVKDDILAGIPQEEWVSTVKKNLKQKFPDGIVVGNNEIIIDGQSRQEMTYSKYMQWLYNNDPQLQADKLRATNNADEILLAATNWVNEGLNHPRKDRIVDFARGNVLLRVGSQEYSADVVVGTRKNGTMMLYDVLNLLPTSFTEKETNAAISTNPSPGAARSTASVSANNISDSEPKGNPQNKKRTAKWLQSVGLQLPSVTTTYGSDESITNASQEGKRKTQKSLGSSFEDLAGRQRAANREETELLAEDIIEDARERVTAENIQKVCRE